MALNTNTNINTISGSDFNTINTSKFYKFLNDDLIHYGFQYKLGLNIDTKKFNPNGECTKGGLYFCEESKCHMFCKYYGGKMGIVSIPDDALVYIEHNKFKADKFIINEIIDFDSVDESFWINMLDKTGVMLRYVKNQTYEICETAVKQNGLAIQYVTDSLLTYDLYKLAIEQNSRAIQYVSMDMIDHVLIESAIRQNGLMLRFITDQTPELCEMAIKQNPLALQYVKDDMLTKELCTMAVQLNGNALSCIDQSSSFFTEELCVMAIQDDYDVLKIIENQTEDMCKLAVNLHGYVLRYVKNQTPEICRLAIEQAPCALQYVNEEYQTEDMCKYAVKRDYRTRHCIKNQILRNMIDNEKIDMYNASPNN